MTFQDKIYEVIKQKGTINSTVKIMYRCISTNTAL